MATLVLPYYNEEDYIAKTIISLAGQVDRRFALILVDNGSTDRSLEIAREAASKLNDIVVTFIEETTPGKVNALRTGLDHCETRYVGTIDADTIYPPNYVGRALRIMQRPSAPVCALAFALPLGGVNSSQHRKLAAFAKWIPEKCHTGGFGQTFDRQILESVGGFDPQRWPFVLEDHEIIHAIAKLGPLGYDPKHVCYPSDRRANRSSCSWTLGERVLYKIMPRQLMDAYFYKILGPRFERRGLRNIALRERQWLTSGDVAS